MLVKKFLYGIRNKLLLVSQVLIPVGFLIISLIVLKTLPDASTPEERLLNLDVIIQTL